MKMFAMVILCSIILATAAYSADEPWVGINLQGVQDWEPNRMFADAMKSSRGWGSPASPGDLAAPVDADGWPTADAGSIIINSPLYQDLGGTYKLSFTGQANVLAVPPALLRVTNVVFNAATNTTTADVVVDNSSHNVSLAFTATHGGVKNVKLMRPGYTTETFTTPFLNLIQPFACLRSIWFSQVINSPVVNWADRTRPTHATQNHQIGGPQSALTGAAWEYAIELSNLTGKDMWINIPDQATDDYVVQLATLLKNTLRPSLHIYVEWSNEVWNGQYAETPRNQAAALAEIAAGNSPLNYDGQTNPGYLAWRRVGKRTKEVSDLFRTVFGDAAMMTQVRPVLCMQCGQTMTIRQPLEFLDAVYGSPSNYLYAIGCAPYFGNPMEWNSRTDLTVDEILGAMPASLGATMAAAKDFSVWAHWYNLKFMTYEGGPSLTGAPSLAAKIAANHDPRIADIVRSFCDQFNQIGGDYLVYYTSVSGDGQFGMFGLTDNVNNLSTPKYQTLLQSLSAPRAAVTAGTAVPGTVLGATYDLQSEFSPAGTGFVTIANGAWYEYLIRVPATGEYTIVPNVGAAFAGARLEASLNSALINTWMVSATGGAQNWADLPATSVHLRAGLNVLRMRTVTGGLNLRAINVAANASSLSFSSPPSVIPNPMTVGLAGAFSVAALGNGATCSWNFGDGSVAVSGESVAHTYASSGTFAVTVTATDILGQTLTAPLSIVVNGIPAPASPGTNSGSNGVADPLPPAGGSGEIGSGGGDIGTESGPNLPGDPAIRPLQLQTFRGTLNFARNGGDGCVMAGLLPQIGKINLAAGAHITLTVGTATVDFILNAHATDRNGNGSVAISMLAGSGAKSSAQPSGARCKFVLKNLTLLRDPASGLAPLTPSTLKVDVSIDTGSLLFATTAEVKYTPKAHGAGKFNK